MAFANGFNGDVKSLQYVLDTLRAKTYLKPGVTANGDITVSVNGEVAYYYKRSAASTDTGTLGGQISFASKGLTRKNIDLTNAITIGVVLPHANINTVEGVNVVKDKIVQEAVSAANKFNELGVAYLETNLAKFYNSANGTVVAVRPANTALTKATIYEEIVNARKAFNVANKADGIKAETIMVSEGVYALLLSAPEFIRQETTQDKVAYNGIVGRIAGLNVVVAVDLEADFIVLNPIAFGAPINVNTLEVGDALAAGYPAGVDFN